MLEVVLEKHCVQSIIKVMQRADVTMGIIHGKLLLWAVMALLLPSISCRLGESLEDFTGSADAGKGDETGAGATGGTAGAGGQSTGGTGGAGGAGETGGTGGTSTVGCTKARDCGPDISECISWACNNGLCETVFAPVGKPISTQKKGDCRINRCGPQGEIQSAVDDTDVPDDDNPCVEGYCVQGEPKSSNVKAGAACGTNLTCDGNGVCIGCQKALDCPGKDTDCRMRTCQAHACGFEYSPSGTQVNQQVVGDCFSLVCDGEGETMSIIDDTDIPEDGNECTYGLCNDGVPSHPPIAAGKPCGTDQVCDGNGLCIKACISATDCPGTDDFCAWRTCEKGNCGMAYKPKGTPLDKQKLPCQQEQCDGSGGVSSVIDDSNLPDDGKFCTFDVCKDGMPSNPPRDAGTPCGTNNACDGEGNCAKACSTVKDCPGSDTFCGSRTCTNGVCRMNYTLPGTPTPNQTAGDCRRNVCDGEGGTTFTADDTDIPVDTNECTDDMCNEGYPSHPPKGLGTLCKDMTHFVCDGKGDCATKRSCQNLPSDACQKNDCCASVLHAGGSYPMGRSITGTDAYASGHASELPEHTVTVTDFYLDVYEVTVGRFRAFVESGVWKLVADAGMRASNSGWNTSWNSQLPSSIAEWNSRLSCHPTEATWTTNPGSKEDYPINCVNWYEAFAFCVWDGGRLPTEAEWEYAAAGGNENRLYPWGKESPTSTRAVYGMNNLLPVGSKPDGNSLWQHKDMAGSVAEWVFDWYRQDWYGAEGNSCTNCINATPGQERVVRGGSWQDSAGFLRSAARKGVVPHEASSTSGFRCARNRYPIM